MSCCTCKYHQDAYSCSSAVMIMVLMQNMSWYRLDADHCLENTYFCISPPLVHYKSIESLRGFVVLKICKHLQVVLRRSILFCGDEGGVGMKHVLAQVGFRSSHRTRTYVLLLPLFITNTNNSILCTSFLFFFSSVVIA